MKKYFVFLNGKLIKSYERKSFAIAKFNKLIKSVDLKSNLIEVKTVSYILMSTGRIADFNFDNLLSDHGC